MASTHALDVALYVFLAVFLFVAIVCYSWEIWYRTEWRTARRQAWTLPSAIREWFNKAFHCSNPADTAEKEGRVDQVDPEQSSTRRNYPVEEASWKEQIRRCVTWTPGVLWFFSFIVPILQVSNTVSHNQDLLRSSKTFWNNSTMTVYGSETNVSDVNADIGGIGIRVGLYIPVGLAVVTLLLGVLHREDTGAKEIGSAQLLTLFYLNFNAAKAANGGFRTLTFPEAVVACMTIDFTAAGLHMTTSGKETLAARWFVGISALNQVIAATMIIAILARIKHNYTNLPGVDIVWWSRINSRDGPSGPVWMYMAVRCVILAHGLWLDARYSPAFHVIEKDWASLAGADQEMERAKEKDRVEPDKPYVSEYQYAVLPATVFGKWVEWLPSILVAISSIETLARRLNYQSDIRQWGQSAALVLAIAGVMHWIYVTGQIVREKMEERYFFHWLRDTSLTLLVPDSRPRYPVNYPRYFKGWDADRGTAGLLRAAEENKMATVRKLLNHGAKINTSEKGMTTLLYAIRYGNLDFVGELMKRGAKHEVAGTLPAFLFAAQEGREKVLDYLRFKGANAFQLDPESGRSALWLAARNGRMNALKTVLQIFETDPGPALAWTPDRSRKTPLYAAAEVEQYEVVRALIERLCTSTPCSGYFEAMKFAADQRSDTALKCLIACGSKSLYRGDEGLTILHLAVRGHLDPPDEQSAHETQQDCHRRVEFIARIFAESKASIHVHDASGRTPLSTAVRSDLDNAYNEHAVKFLLRFGAEPFAEDLDGRSPFLRYLEWRGQYVQHRFFRQKEDSALEYPFLQLLLADSRPPDANSGNRRKLMSKTVAVGLCNLPAHVIYWLERNRWIDVMSGIQKGGGPLLLHAILSGRVAALVALMSTDCHNPKDVAVSFKEGRSFQAKGEYDYVDTLTAHALKSLWTSHSEPRRQAIKAIVQGGTRIMWTSGQDWYILTDPDNPGTHEVNCEAQGNAGEQLIFPQRIQNASALVIDEEALTRQVEKFYQDFTISLLDPSCRWKRS